MFMYFSRGDFSVAISQCLLLAFVAALPFIGGCGADDNPIVDDHDHGEEEPAPFHADADGFVLEVGETEVYRQFQGSETGGLTVGVGEEIEVHVVFLNASGTETHIGEEEHDHDHAEEEAFALSLTGYDSTVIEIHMSEDEAEHEHDEHDEHDEHEHEEPGHDEHVEEAFARFEITGLKAGTTEIRLQLLHGDHADFTAALPIPVTVQ